MGFRVFFPVIFVLDFWVFGFLGLCLGLDFLFKFWFVLPLLGFRVFFLLLGFWVCFVIGFLGFFRYFCSFVIDFLFLFFRY